MILIQEALLRCFAIDEIVKMQAVEAGPLSVGWDVTVRSGGSDQRWFVKRHVVAPPGRVAFGLNLGEALRKQGLDLIPQLVSTKDDYPWFELDGRFYSAQQYIEADQPLEWSGGALPNVEQCRAAGEGLAAFHKAVLAVTPELPIGWEFLAGLLLGRIHDSWSNALRHALMNLPPEDAIRQIVETRAAVLTSRLDEVLQGCSEVPGGRILLHGDYHPGNVLYRGDKLVAILDLDYTYRAPANYDAGYALYMFCRKRVGGGEDRIDGKAAAAFLQGFNEEPFKQVQPFLDLAPFVVGYWLLEQYVSHSPARPALMALLVTALGDCERSFESVAAKL
jgi:Ser/Thr protein kinase RdoA (MazF antagonist)